MNQALSSSSNGLEKRPKLRFPGFDEPWQSTVLSSVFAKNTKKNTDGRITNVICNSAKQGLIPQREYFDKDIANSDNTSGYYIIEENDFVYNPRKSTDAPYGPISSYKYADAGIVSPLYLCFRAKKEINPAFFEWYFRSSAWHRYVYMSGDSGARHDRVSIKDDTFFAMPINLPSPHEQEHIAAFLERIDQRIEKQRALVENLKKYKRGAVDSLLAQKLNFSSHTKWEELKISDLFSPVSDKGHSDLTVLTIVQGIGTLPRDSVDRRISYDKASTNTYKRVEKNDFILHLRSFEGGLELANSEGVVSPAYTILRANKVISPSFYYAYFRSYWFISNKLRIAVEGIRDGKSINMDTFWNIKIPYPLLDEQYQIAEYLRTVDTRLTNAEQVLGNLLRLRSGLMQQLFI